MRLRAAVVVTLFGATALTGCSADDASDGSGDASGRPTGAAPTQAAYTVEDALRDLPPVEPQDDEPVTVYSGDLVRATELGDLPDPTGAKSTAAWADGLRTEPLAVFSYSELGLDRLASGAMRSVLGFDARDVDHFASLASLPAELTVVDLADGAALTADVTTSGPGKPGDIDPSESDEAAFPFVHGVAEQEGRVGLSKTADLLDSWVGRGKKSLADDPALLDIAQVLDERDVYGAVVSDRPPRNRSFSSEVLEGLGQAAIPAYDAVGIGQGVEDGEAVEYVAYRFDDAAAARDTVEDVWVDGASFNGGQVSEIVSVDDVTVSGDVVVVSLSDLQVPYAATVMLEQGDTPFAVLD